MLWDGIWVIISNVKGDSIRLLDIKLIIHALHLSCLHYKTSNLFPFRSLSTAHGGVTALITTILGDPRYLVVPGRSESEFFNNSHINQFLSLFLKIFNKFYIILLFYKLNPISVLLILDFHFFPHCLGPLFILIISCPFCEQIILEHFCLRIVLTWQAFNSFFWFSLE